MDLAKKVNELRVFGGRGRPSRHQAIVLLWAIGRLRSGLPRLVRWSSARDELKHLLAKYGRSEQQPSPEYPFVALAHTDLWELVGAGDVPPAHGSMVLRWLDDMDPEGGLRLPIYDLLAADSRQREEIVKALLGRFFVGVSFADLLRDTGVDYRGIDTQAAGQATFNDDPRAVAQSVTVRTVPPEGHEVAVFTVMTAAEQREDQRREAELLERYIAWLTLAGRPSVRNEIWLHSNAQPLYTDLFDEALEELVEAKGSVTRDHVRFALGQVLDYARFVEHRSLAVLLPSRPSGDLVWLLITHGVSCIFETDSGADFDRVDPP